MRDVITFKHKGNFKNSEKMFNRCLKQNYLEVLENYGRIGVQLLKQNTPKDSGKTANSWDYKIEKENGRVVLSWTNSNTNKGQNIALLLIYGHGLQNGSYVQGNDFVSPVIEPLFRELANKCWKEAVR